MPEVPGEGKWGGVGAGQQSIRIVVMVCMAYQGSGNRA